MYARLDDAAAKAGRDPADLRRILNVNGEITDGESNGALHGPVDQCFDELMDLAATCGVDMFVLWAEGEDQMRRLAEEVTPAVRDQVSAMRA